MTAGGSDRDSLTALLADALRALPGCCVSILASERRLLVLVGETVAASVRWPAGADLADGMVRARIVREAVAMSARGRADAALRRVATRRP